MHVQEVLNSVMRKLSLTEVENPTSSHTVVQGARNRHNWAFSLFVICQHLNQRCDSLLKIHYDLSQMTSSMAVYLYTHPVFLLLRFFPPFYPKPSENSIKHHCWLIFIHYYHNHTLFLSLSFFNYCYYSFFFFHYNPQNWFHFYVHYCSFIISFWLHADYS